MCLRVYSTMTNKKGLSILSQERLINRLYAISRITYNYIENRIRSDNPITVQDRITEETIENSANQPFNNSTFRKRDQNGNPYQIDDGDRIEVQITQFSLACIILRYLWGL